MLMHKMFRSVRLRGWWVFFGLPAFPLIFLAHSERFHSWFLRVQIVLLPPGRQPEAPVRPLRAASSLSPPPQADRSPFFYLSN